MAWPSLTGDADSFDPRLMLSRAGKLRTGNAGFRNGLFALLRVAVSLATENTEVTEIIRIIILSPYGAKLF